MVKNKVSTVWNCFASLCTKLLSASESSFVFFTLLYYNRKWNVNGNLYIGYPFRLFLYYAVGQMRTYKDICGQSEPSYNSRLYICIKQEKRSNIKT